MISYAHKDVEIMRKLRAGLNDAGLTTWVDDQGLGAGSQFFNKIGEAICNAQAVVFLLSPNSAKSRYCKDVRVTPHKHRSARAQRPPR